MSTEESKSPKRGWISRIWRFLWRPSTTISLAALLFSNDGSRQAVVLVNFYSLSDDSKAAFRQLADEACCG